MARDVRGRHTHNTGGSLASGSSTSGHLDGDGRGPIPRVRAYAACYLDMLHLLPL